MACFNTAKLQVAKTVDLIKAKGGTVTREPGPVKGGKSVIAFVEDPDGYKFELIESGPTPEPLCQVMLRVGDLDRAINFYEKVSYWTGTAIKVSLISDFLNESLNSAMFLTRHLAWSFFASETILNTRLVH